MAYGFDNFGPTIIVSEGMSCLKGFAQIVFCFAISHFFEYYY